VRSIDELLVGVVDRGIGTDKYDVEEEADDAVPIVEGGIVEEVEFKES
jgi:predicted HTH domain antitoxin